MRYPGCFLSGSGINTVRQKKKDKGYKDDASQHDEVLVGACKYFDCNWNFSSSDTLYLPGINAASWKRFLSASSKQRIHPRVFAAYCYALDINWNEVIDPSCITTHTLKYLIPKTEESSEDSDRAAFVRDVTCPDGSIFHINEKFIKVWELQNAGKVVWEKRYLTRIDDHSGMASIRSPKRIQIPLTKPGELVQLSVPLQAPPLPTHTKATWKMTFSNHKTDFCFPNKYNCGIVVEITTIQ